MKLFRTCNATSLQRKKKITQTPCIQLIIIIEYSFRNFQGVFATFFFFSSNLRMSCATPRTFLEAAFRLINGIERLLVVSRNRHREGKDLRARVRDRPDRQSMARRKSMAKSESDEIKKQKREKKRRQNCVRFYDWLRSPVRPSSWRNRCSPSASKALTSRRELVHKSLGIIIEKFNA